MSGEDESDGGLVAAEVTDGRPVAAHPPCIATTPAELYRVEHGELGLLPRRRAGAVDRFVAGAGATVAIPGGREHTVRNESDRRGARLRRVFARGGDGGVRPRGGGARRGRARRRSSACSRSRPRTGSRSPGRWRRSHDRARPRIPDDRPDRGRPGWAAERLPPLASRDERGRERSRPARPRRGPHRRRPAPGQPLAVGRTARSRRPPTRAARAGSRRPALRPDQFSREHHELAQVVLFDR